MTTTTWINEKISQYLEAKKLEDTPVNRHNALVTMRIVWANQSTQLPLKAKRLNAVDREIIRLRKKIQYQH